MLDKQQNTKLRSVYTSVSPSLTHEATKFKFQFQQQTFRRLTTHETIQRQQRITYELPRTEWIYYAKNDKY